MSFRGSIQSIQDLVAYYNAQFERGKAGEIPPRIAQSLVALECLDELEKLEDEYELIEKIQCLSWDLEVISNKTYKSDPSIRVWVDETWAEIKALVAELKREVQANQQVTPQT